MLNVNNVSSENDDCKSHLIIRLILFVSVNSK